MHCRSGSNKRRLSRESFVKRKRMEYGDSGDASSEDSDKEVVCTYLFIMIH